MSSLEDYIEHGEIVFLEKHISDLETRLSESMTAKSQVSQYVHDLTATVDLLKKILDFYVRLS